MKVRPVGAAWRGHVRARRLVLVASVVLFGAVIGGCARWNTYYNANKAFRGAEQEREEKLKSGGDVSQPTGNQKKLYERAIEKAQHILDEYPGSSLTDDALFLMAKSYHRLASYRMSLAKIDLLFANYPATPYTEEALYLQALNYLYVGDLANSTVALESLESGYPRSRFQADALRVRAENSFKLRDWEGARRGFADYLERFPKADGADRAGYELGLALFELKAYAEAAEHLRAVVTRTVLREVSFDSRLLLARIYTRLGQYDEAEREIAGLREEAELYKAQGDVLLVEAEVQLARGRPEAAAPLLENLPQEWRTPTVSAHAADLLGRVYFRQWRLEDASKQLREATRNANILPDPGGTRALLAHLQAYLAAEEALPNARPEREAALKLTQANALLLGLGRPRLALACYLEVAAMAAADSAMAARGLYGAALVYRDSLSAPDSAAVLLDRLQQEHPHTPQAFVARTGTGGDLLSFLRDEQARQQRREPGGSPPGALPPAFPDTALSQEVVPGMPVPEGAPADSALAPPYQEPLAAESDSAASPWPGAAPTDTVPVPGEDEQP